MIRINIVTIAILLLVTGATLDFHQVAIDRPLFGTLRKSEKVKSILEQLSYHRRQNLIAQLDGDMGDTLQRTGSYYTLLSYLGVEKDDLERPLRQGFENDLKELMVEPGYYRRSNDLKHWSGDPQNCSRDQMISLQTAIVTTRDINRGREIFMAFAKRGFFNQNIRHNDTLPGDAKYAWKIPDPPSPMQLSLMLRGLGTWTVYPMVFVLDTALMFDVTVFRRLNSRELWDSDIKNLPILIAANSYLPTPWSAIAIELYIEQHRDIERRVNYYNDPSNNGIPPLAKIYSLAIEELAQPNTIEPHSELAHDRRPASHPFE
ncbi:MAG: hypothetical protein RJB66_525 [Pseudomonadota bacterium]